MYETLDLSIDPRGVATLTLNRPDKHNAMSGQMLDDLAAAAAALAVDTAVRAVILTGAGKSFCAGGDLGWMQAQRDAPPATRADEAMKLARTLKTLDTLPKPLIGAVQGNAFGGGLGLMSVCDVAVGVDTARFGFTETRLGLIPATIGPYVIARMGAACARRVFMSARVFDAAEAVDLGLLARIVPADGLEAAIEAEVTPYLACAPGAVAAAKALIGHIGGGVDEAMMTHTAAELGKRWESAEGAEGIDAFFSKRKPGWIVD